jgi:hypothetical protein
MKSGGVVVMCVNCKESDDQYGMYAALERCGVFLVLTRRLTAGQPIRKQLVGTVGKWIHAIIIGS